MVKRRDKERVNFTSMVTGIVLIFLGLGISAITIPTKSIIIIIPIILLILGSILALTGGLRKW